jgi:hypothetical protein
MSAASAANQQLRETETLATGDRVCHQEHGDGVIVGGYGDKVAVDFDNVGTKRVPPESITRATPMSDAMLARIYRERDARRAKARAQFDRMLAEQRRESGHSAEIIPFPSHRIVRHVRHGHAVIISAAEMRGIAQPWIA